MREEEKGSWLSLSFTCLESLVSVIVRTQWKLNHFIADIVCSSDSCKYFWGKFSDLYIFVDVNEIFFLVVFFIFRISILLLFFSLITNFPLFSVYFDFIKFIHILLNEVGIADYKFRFISQNLGSSTFFCYWLQNYMNQLYIERRTQKGWISVLEAFVLLDFFFKIDIDSKESIESLLNQELEIWLHYSDDSKHKSSW